MLRRATVALICALTGCAAAPERSEDAEYWSVQVQRAIAQRSHLDDDGAVRSLIPYEWIIFERRFDPRYDYRVVLSRDGTAQLATDHFSDGAQLFEGRISLKEYARLSQMVDAARRASSWSSYSGQWTDDSVVKIEAGSAQESWTVSDYGEVAPVEVWALEQVLDMIRQDIEWTARVRP